MSGGVKRFTIEGVAFNDGTIEQASESSKTVPPNTILTFVLASDHDACTAAMEGRLHDSSVIHRQDAETIARQAAVIAKLKEALLVISVNVENQFVSEEAQLAARTRIREVCDVTLTALEGAK